MLNIYKIQVTKASLINTFVLKMVQRTMCDVKAVALRDKPTENYHPTPSSTEHFGIFHFIVLVFLHANLQKKKKES